MKKDITIIPNLVELEQQFEYVNSLIEQHRSSAIAKVNIEALLTNWEVGQYISQQLKSAHWGAKVVSELADYLKRMNPKRRGFGKRHLYNMVKFYDTYSTDEFNQLGKLLRLDEFVQLPIAQTEEGEIAQSVPTQLPLNEIVQSPIAQLGTPLINMPRILALATFTSHIEIMNRCKSYDERVFYMLYAARQRLNTEELRRCTFFRITIPCHEAAGNVIADIASKDNHDPKGDPKELSERQLLILDIIKKDDLITILQMAQKITVSEKTIKRELAILQEKGVLTREGGRKEGKWVINNKYQ